MLGELAKFIYDAAAFQVPEMAIAGALGFMAGICGPAYNYSGTGLNLYVIYLATSSGGKESMASGIDKLINSISNEVPVVRDIIIASEIASGSGLFVKIAEKRNGLAVLGEFGYRMKVICNPKAPDYIVNLKRMLMDIYHKSGKGRVINPMLYSDKAKIIPTIENPTFSILAESTPETLYDELNENMIIDGLLPRFLIIEYDGLIPYINKNHVNVFPNDDLRKKLMDLVSNCRRMMNNNEVINVSEIPKAGKMLDDISHQQIDMINNKSERDIIRKLWSRLHIKTFRTASLMAVGGENPYYPVILPEYVEWAYNLVTTDINRLVEKIKNEGVGNRSFETEQQKELIRLIKEYVTKDWSLIRKYTHGDNAKLIYDKKFIPDRYLNKRVQSLSCYTFPTKNDASKNLDKTIRFMIENGILRRLTSDELKPFNTTAKIYNIVDKSILD